MIAIVLIACSGSDPIQNENPTDIDAMVEARAKELVAAQAKDKPITTEVATPLPTHRPTITPTPRPIKTPTPTPLPTRRPTITPNFVGMWQYSEEVDAVAGIMAQYLEISPVSSEGSYGDSILMSIACLAPYKDFAAPYFLIDWGSTFDGLSTLVVLRWDSEDAISGEWDVTVEGVVKGEWEAEWFVKDMIDHNQLVARVFPNTEPFVFTTTFDIRGLDEAIKPLYDGCPSLKPSR